jgi:hypothetical protein
MYKASSTPPGAPGAPPQGDGGGPSADGAGAKKKDDVVDAEFVDVDEKK